MLDGPSQQTDPNMADLFFYPRSHVTAFESPTGQIIHDFLMSRTGAALLIGAVLAAPSRPPVVAVEPFLASLVGDAAFTDEMKKYTGRLVRQVIEHLGGTFVRRSVKVTVQSRYRSGSVYNFGSGFLVDNSSNAITEIEKVIEQAARIRSPQPIALQNSARARE